MDIDEQLPHKAPVKFIKTVEVEGENHAVSLVEFNDKPTLSAVVEAAAQNIIFIKSIFNNNYNGVLTGMKNVQLLKELDSGIYTVTTDKLAELDNFFILKFILSKEDDIYADGEVSIYRESK